MIPGLAYTHKGFYISNQVESRPMYSSSGLGATGLHTRGLSHLVNTLIFIVDRVDVHTREKSQLHLVGLLYTSPPGVLKNGTPHNSTSEQSARKLTI